MVNKIFELQEKRIAEQFPEYTSDKGWRVVKATDYINEFNTSVLTIVKTLEKEMDKPDFYPETGASFVKTNFVNKIKSPKGYEYIQVEKDGENHIFMVKK